MLQSFQNIREVCLKQDFIFWRDASILLPYLSDQLLGVFPRERRT